MADIFETRSISERFAGSRHLFRVACIGDSMLYGQGVPPRQALPAQLGRMLNAALIDRLVWADNFGQSSGNLWHAWPLFRHRAASMRFDALVFAICQNDLQVFESNTVRYATYDACWKPDAPGFRAALALFDDVARFAGANRLPTLVVFYTNTPGDRPYIDALAPELARRGLPFVDMLDHYQRQTSITNETFRASEFDGHPSALGHELAARRVARDLLAILPASAEGAFAADPAREVALAMDDLVAGGVAADLVIAWAGEAAAAKERAARRSSSETMRSLGAAAAPLRTELQALACRWRGARRIDARAIEAGLGVETLAADLSGAYHATRNLDEIAILLLGQTQTALLADLGRQFGAGYYEQLGRLESFTGDLSAEAAAIGQRLKGASEIADLASGSCLAPVGSGRALDAHLRPVTLREELESFAQMLFRLRMQMANLAAHAPASFNDPDIRRLWAIACHLGRAAAIYLERIAIPFGNGVEPSNAVLEPWTMVDVVLEGGPDSEVQGHVCSLRVEADYVTPRRMRVREAHWAGVGKDRATYRFEVPALFFGSLSIGVADFEPTRARFLRGTTRIAQIRIASGEAERDGAAGAVEWRNPGENLPVIRFDKIRLF